MISEEHLQEIEKLSKKSEAVKSLLDFYVQSQSDPSERLRNEMKEMAAVIADDFKVIRTDGEKIIIPEGAESGVSNLKILGSNKDDKLFERIMAIFDKSPKIYEAISVVSEIKDPIKKIDKKHENKVIV